MDTTKEMDGEGRRCTPSATETKNTGLLPVFFVLCGMGESNSHYLIGNQVFCH